jgi:hypothetical protein
MGKQTSVLDGPRMGYGPGQQQSRGGVPLSTVILAIVCVVLAGLLALSIAGRHQAATVAGTSTASGSPSPTSTEAPPPGATDAVTTFFAAWALPPADRDNSLASVTVTGVPDAIDDATAVKLAKTKAVGDPAYTRLADRSLRADQRLADGSTVQLQMVFDQAAIYGWLVSSVQLG